MHRNLPRRRPGIVTVRAVAPVDVMLLGPPRVARDGEAVAFDTRKALALLAVLALADRPRPRDVLAELLWPEHDAEHARGALRRTLSALRSAIGGDFVQATRDQVSLVRGPSFYVDVDRFRELAEAGDVAGAAALFRGEFLEGFGLRDAPGFEDWQRGEADELRRELAAVLARLVEATGDVAVAQRWLELDPLHEPAHRALIRLHAERGDRAAALAQYRECVRTLSRELGVPPLAETTRLYEAISEGTLDVAPRATEGPAAAPAAAPPRAPLIGRAREWAALLEAYDGIDADGAAVLLEGEAGIGKTRLAEELAAHARERGAAVLGVRAYEEEAALAYGPLVEALRGRLRDGDGWVADVGDRALCEAARLVPELSTLPPPPLDGPAAQARFLDGVWETLTAAAAGSVPGLLVIDDVQWADEATLGLLTYGLRRLGGRRLLVLLTSRAPLRRVPARVIALERLGEDEVGELLRANGGPSELAPRLYAETEGLPFLLVEYLNALGGDPDWSLPAGARELLLGRLEPVSETGRQVLSAAAAIGRSFAVDTVRAASGRGDEETVTALEELVQRGLIREGRFDYDFAHEQLRRLVAEETSLARRRLLHGRVAEALAGGRPLTDGAAADPLAGRSAEIARHLRLAGRDAEAAAAYRRAAEHARSLFANAEALEHLRAALAVGDPEPGSLHAAIGDLQTLQGEYAAALASYETAAAHAAPEDVGAIEHRLGQVRHRRGEWALATAQFEAALAATPEDDLAARARITADLSLSAHDGGDPARAAELAEQARELAEAAGDPRALGQAHNLLGALATSGGAAADALDHLRRSLELAEATDDPGARVAALNNLALAHRARGELEPALELTGAALDLCAAQGDRHREAALHNNLADLLHAAGRHEDAMAQLKRAVAIFAEVGAEGEPQPEVWKLARW
jgi:DNA-binding SARP family transcriptional activator/tetratricopeptide (TPR) repeat protein